MILEPKKIKSVTVSIVSPSICHEIMGLFFSMVVLKPDSLVSQIQLPYPWKNRALCKQTLPVSFTGALALLLEN